jgi:2-dehydro-3-deoxygluconokinase
LSKLFSEIAGEADILLGNEEDFQLCLGITGPEAGGEGLAGKIEAFKGMITNVQKEYRNASVFATTLRQVVSANSHLWGAILSMDNEWFVAEPRQIDILDRIGGGDGFTGGLLYGILNGWEPEKCLHFGWATGAMVPTLYTDYALPADEDQVWSIWEGNARVKR